METMMNDGFNYIFEKIQELGKYQQASLDTRIFTTVATSTNGAKKKLKEKSAEPVRNSRKRSC